MIEAIIYLVAIVAAEVVTVFFQPLWGIIFHVMVLSALIVHSSLAVGHSSREFLLSLALVPLIRILSLSMPLAALPQIYWYPIIYAPLLAGALVVMWRLNFSAGEVGLTVRMFPIQLVIGLTGVAFGVAEYIILSPEPLLAELSLGSLWLPAIILGASTGFVEELVFRGVLQRASGEVLGRWGLIYVSFLFAILHVGFLSGVEVVFVFGIALFFGWVVKETGSLLGVTLSHGITNVFLYLVVPFLLA